MRRLAGCLMCLMVLALAGCGPKQPAAPAGDASHQEAGGYARDLAAPPSKPYDPTDATLDANIKAGTSTDTREKPPEPTAEEKARAAKAAAEDKRGQPTNPVEPTAKPDPKNTDGDAKYKDWKKPVLAMQTRRGVMYLELWPETAPKTVKAICKLARDGFYNGIFIHRLEPGFVAQFGDPLTKGKGAQAPGAGTGGPGFTIPAEFSKTLKHTKGILSMARTEDPNSAGSQMFIVLDDAPHLDGKYTIFGKVLPDSMPLVGRIALGDRIDYLWVVKDLPEGMR